MVNNPRYPHDIIVRRIQSDESGVPITDDNGDIVYSTILTSTCGLRTMTDPDVNSGISQTDIKVSIPTPLIDVLVKIKDLVVFKNNIDGEILNGEVSSYRVNNFGYNIFFHING